ncbi:STAS domain-containing protein [Anaeromyxobacter diazotrophicus]|uniref:MlaB-like STAS domain-containing protein n=1 Tax=Anaeromyxobacter diazotrophicus TaxID=2590199 RepID=A0A7I9VTM2_9BACT|nr:STAS domain-containing protein [Anaeromyxobacter diazotrophicus]GEJ59307.1 hypothetical protein AMYX_40480 [Anaeromyxobacter diazotrophicus]
MTQVTRTPTGAVLVQVEGTFDAVAAREVRARLRALPPDAQVVVDFGRVREFLDVGVAFMAPWFLEAHAQPVAVRGLRQHQRRLFRYFGVDLDGLRAAVLDSEAAR